MPRPPKEPTARRAVMYRVRLTAAERDDLDRRAAAAGLTPSAFARCALLDCRPPALARVDPVALRQLQAIGNNLNQLARHANRDDGLAEELGDELRATLAGVKRAMAKLLET